MSVLIILYVLSQLTTVPTWAWVLAWVRCAFYTLAILHRMAVGE